MAGWVIREFKGISPVIDDRVLPDSAATTANNCTVDSGKLVPLRAAQSIGVGASSTTSIYRFNRDSGSLTSGWIIGHDDEIVKGSVASDTQETTFVTGRVGYPEYFGADTMVNGSVGYYRLGIPAPDSAPAAYVTNVNRSESDVLQDTVYVYTYVNNRGWEGAPSAPSNLVSVALGETVTVGNLGSSPPSGPYAITSKRVYRAVEGEYLFVVEVPINYSSVNDIGATAEAIPSLELYPPPYSLRGLVALPNGVMAGFTGYDIYFSEPYMPHAYPPSYMQSVDADIVAIAPWGTSLLVLTNHRPFLISGTHPSTYGMTMLDVPQPCMSKRSVAVTEQGVIYASPDGLVLVTDSGSQVITRKVISRAWWHSKNPATIHGVHADGKYYGFWGSGGGGFVFDVLSGVLTTHSVNAYASYYDSVFDLVLVNASGVISKFDQYGAGVNLTATWKSKTFYSPRPISMAAGRVEAAGYPVTVNVYGDGSLVKSTQVTASNLDGVFRLPRDRHKEWAIEVSSTHTLYSVAIAETLAELKHG